MIKKVTELVHNVNSSQVWGFYPYTEFEDVIKLYPKMDIYDFKKMYGINNLCKAASLKMHSALRDNGFMSNILFVYCRNFSIFHLKSIHIGFNRWFLKRILKYSTNIDFDIRNILNIGYGYSTHALVEVFIHDNYYVIDPFAGVFYNKTKEDLIANPDSSDCYYSCIEQSTYLNNFIHLDNANLVYTSSLFWRNVLRITYNLLGDLPIKKGKLCVV